MKLVQVADVGSLVIRGKIDTSDIDAGFVQINNNFEKTKQSTRSFNSDLVRSTSLMSSFSKSIALAGTAAAGLLTGLVKDAPAVAPAIANMQLSMTRLKFALGEDVKPAFDELSNSFSKFVNLVQTQESSSLISGFFEGFTAPINLFIDLLEKAYKKWKSFKESISGEEPEKGGGAGETEKDIEESIGKVAGVTTATAVGATALNKITKGGFFNTIKEVLVNLASLPINVAGSLFGVIGGTSLIPSGVFDLSSRISGNPFSAYHFSNNEEAKSRSFEHYIDWA